MHRQPWPAAPRVVFLFTSFPVLSETFLQREMRYFHEAGLPLELVSLWSGQDSWNGLSVERNGIVAALSGIFWLPYWLIKEPSKTLFFLGQLWRPRESGLLNWVENLVGFSYALRSAKRWKRQGAGHFHAVWASAPGMAAWALSTLSQIPFSISGHAYDLYEKGGDGWLALKAQQAEWIRTSTQAGRARWKEIGADSSKVLVVGRGLPELPPWKSPVPIAPPFRLLSVGRMVQKMGFDRQIPLFLKLREAGIPFSVEWIGDGPERKALKQAVAEAGLGGIVKFTGRLPYDKVEEAYQRNDIFLFTGRIDSRGDRAGLPNAVAEAMAWGLLIFATNVGAVTEAIENGINGFVWDENPEHDTLLSALGDPALQDRCRLEAREWIDAHYQLKNNLGPLIARFKLVTFSASVG